MMSVNLNYIAILNINGADYCCIINRIRNYDAVNLLQNANLKEGKKYHKIKNIYYHM